MGDKDAVGSLGHLGHFVTREKSPQELGVICVYPYIILILKLYIHDPIDPKGLEPYGPRIFPVGSRHQKT